MTTAQADKKARHSQARIEEPASAPRAKKPSQRKNAQPPHLKYREFTVDAGLYGISQKNFPNNALAIVKKLLSHGYEAYIVGGAIRDLLLDKSAKDFDIATSARPEEIQKIFGRQCRLIGRRFRLAHVVFGREVYEVSTFRAEHHLDANEKMSKTSETGMLLRDNVYGTLREDAERRDFTVNALYYDVAHNLIFDFFDGIQDLKIGQLRLIGEPRLRYQEDPVRMLRAIRFMAKLEMFLAPETDAPIRHMAGLLKHIPAARLFEESLKLLQAGSGLKTSELLRKYGLFEPLFPVLTPFLSTQEETPSEKMLRKALTATDERIRDDLRVNPAFLFAALLWYPLREKIDELKNEGGLNTADAAALAANEVLAQSCRALALHRRHTGVIRDIWALQFQFSKRTAKRAQQTLEHIKFRAAFDLLVLRAEIEGGDLVELSAWWHEFQFSNEAQREALLKQIKPRTAFGENGSVELHSEPKKRRRRRRYHGKKKNNAEA